MKNNGYTQFSIIGNFDVDSAVKQLGIRPHRFWRAGETDKEGHTPLFSRCDICMCKEYSNDMTQQLEKTILPLLDKIPILKQIKKENDVDLVVELYAYLNPYGEPPMIATSKKVIDFCHEINAEVECEIIIINS